MEAAVEDLDVIRSAVVMVSDTANSRYHQPSYHEGHVMKKQSINQSHTDVALRATASSGRDCVGLVDRLHCGDTETVMPSGIEIDARLNVVKSRRHNGLCISSSHCCFLSHPRYEDATSGG